MLFDLRSYQTGNSILPSDAIANHKPTATVNCIVSFVARWFSVPQAFAHYTDSRLKWLTSSQGMPEAWTNRDISLLIHTFDSDKSLVVSDTLKDPRYCDNALVADPIGIRFYAGTPLMAPDGERLGTLCILDRRPKQLSAKELDSLREFAQLAGNVLHTWLTMLAGNGDNLALDSAEQRYRELFENTTDAVYTHDLSGQLTAVNRAAERLLGYTRDELLTMNITDLALPEHEQVMRQMVLEQYGGGTSHSYELKFRAKNGKQIKLLVGAHLLFTRGQPVGLMGFARDITSHIREKNARTRAEKKLTRTEEELDRYTTHLEDLHRLITKKYKTIEELHADYLKAGCNILNVQVGIIAEVKENFCYIHASESETDALPLNQAISIQQTRFQRTINQRKTFQYTIKRISNRKPIYAKQGASFLLSTPIFIGQRLWGVLCFASRKSQPLNGVINKQAVVELMAKGIGNFLLDEELKAARCQFILAQRDHLTGLLNGRSLTEGLEQAIRETQGKKKQTAVILIDIDRFRQFNDPLGPVLGDSLLRQIGERLKTNLDSRGCLGRMGSDRFAAIVNNLESIEEAKQITRQLLEAFRKPFRLDMLDLFVTASLGASLFPSDGISAAELFQNADVALRQIKKKGGNDLLFYAPQDTASALERLELDSYLHRALENREFGLRFQPLIDMDGTIAGLEALLSWKNPKLGVVPAARFIPAAEDSGIIVPLGAWVLNEACRQNASWQRKGYPAVNVAVNVSAVQFARADFVEVVKGALERNGLEPSYLELEVTESVVMRDIDQSVETMERLRDLGIRISIDDFGTGYSSLNYLRRLPLDSLKIDRSFLNDADKPKSALPLIESIVSLAHCLDLTVICEGVENWTQLELVRKAGCDRVQGHLFGRSITSVNAGELLKSRNQFL